ncbi:hypothetical protein CCACVL1_17338 [Corchorus capsularis]|uniref:Uncharacterized protein n=1 Tax=Corchorus capsularis TaxID=210143 RepID=A0A1R3HSD4_COCAP|nr:hypothetical protein CCACVL1_17338 [Corchorus capsularis]
MVPEILNKKCEFSGIKQMGSLRSWSDRVEAMDDKEEGSKHMTEFEVSNKPHSRDGSSASNSSSEQQNPGNYDESSNFEFISSPEESNQNQKPSKKIAEQVHAEGYEPNRIPSSIFNSKPATPMDWSTASNESLFSIHIGNNSFSKDQFFALYKSGELTKLDEHIITQGLPHPSELESITMKNVHHVVNAGEIAKKDDNNHNHNHNHNQPKMAPIEDVSPEITKNTPTIDYGHQVAPNHSSSSQGQGQEEVHKSHVKSISGRSDGSNNSALSFNFPVLTDPGRLSNVNDQEQNIKGLKTKSAEQQPEKQTKEEVPPSPQSPATTAPQNSSSRSWFSWFYCCRCS